MIEPTLHQEPEGIRPGAIWWVGIGVIVVSALLIVIAWWLVAPQSASERAVASPLKHDLIEQTTAGEEVRAAGEQRLERYEWVDRRAGVVRIPIDRAIDAVLADPRLIGASSPALASEVAR